MKLIKDWKGVLREWMSQFWWKDQNSKFWAPKVEGLLPHKLSHFGEGQGKANYPSLSFEYALILLRFQDNFFLFLCGRLLHTFQWLFFLPLSFLLMRSDRAKRKKIHPFPFLDPCNWTRFPRVLLSTWRKSSFRARLYYLSYKNFVFSKKDKLKKKKELGWEIRSTGIVE